MNIVLREENAIEKIFLTGLLDGSIISGSVEAQT